MAFLWNVPGRNHPNPSKDTSPDVWGEVGITPLGLTEAFGAAVLLFVAVYFVFMYRYPVAQAPTPTPGEAMCTADAQQCPDGSFVGRTGPNCEFVCPGEADMSDWKTYTNTEYGFEFRYPAKAKIEYIETPYCALGSLGCVTIAVPFNDLGHVIWARRTLDWYKELFKEDPLSTHEVRVNEFSGLDLWTKANPELYAESVEELYLSRGNLVIRFFESPLGVGIAHKPDIMTEILYTFRFITPVDTSTWKTYRNEEYGFEVKYPADLKVQVRLGGTHFIYNAFFQSNEPYKYFYVGVSTPDSITKHNAECDNYEGECYRFEPLECESVNRNSCSEHVQRYLMNNFEGVFWNSNQKLRINLVYPMEFDEKYKYLDTFKTVLSTFKFLK